MIVISIIIIIITTIITMVISFYTGNQYNYLTTFYCFKCYSLAELLLLLYQVCFG